MIRYRKAKKEAARIWKEIFYARGAPFNIVVAAMGSGLDIVDIDCQDEGNPSALFDIHRKTILVNHEHSVPCRAFAIAHLLGHWLLHGKAFFKIYPNERIYYRKPIGAKADWYNKEANHFAAHLLVPSKLLTTYSCISVAELARRFVIPHQVIGYRRTYRR